MKKCIYCGKRVGFFGTAHKKCAQKEMLTKKIRLQAFELISKRANAFFENLEIANRSDLNTLATQSKISIAELDEMLVQLYADRLDKFLDLGPLSTPQEGKLSAFMNNFDLSQSMLEAQGSYGKMLRAVSLRKLLNEEPFIEATDQITQTALELNENEAVLWIFKNVTLHQQSVEANFDSDSQGLYLRIAKKKYYRQSSFKNRPLKTLKVIPSATGMLTLTNTHIHFSSAIKKARFTYQDILFLEPYTDAIGIQKTELDGRPFVFKNVDGWFCFNLIKNVLG